MEINLNHGSMKLIGMCIWFQLIGLGFAPSACHRQRTEVVVGSGRGSSSCGGCGSSGCYHSGYGSGIMCSWQWW